MDKYRNIQMKVKNKIQRYILDNVITHPRDITRLTASEFGITRQAVNRYLQQLVETNLLISKGTTRNKEYVLKPLTEVKFELTISEGLEEDRVWRERIDPLLEGLPRNIYDICNYGFTEMLNNVIYHSEGQKVNISITITVATIDIIVDDDGIGIFNKIQRELHLEHPRDAILELSKGKFTTDPERHTGEGIFFTSKMFDKFIIYSGNLAFIHQEYRDGILLEEYDREKRGTIIEITIRTNTTRTPEHIFKKFTVDGDDFGFSKTIVPVELVRYGNENLISRSQAKRLLVRFERFKEIVLDFKGVDKIGQAFADEIFRVFCNQHPDINIHFINTNNYVKNMISRARSVNNVSSESSQ
jgi:anti-sigma regulatory factor (Ser/Thr protein kinase)